MRALHAFIIMLCLILTLPAQGRAQEPAQHEPAKKVLVEYFSMPLCSLDANYHGMLDNIRLGDDEVLILNCPIAFRTEEHSVANDDPGVDFCEWRSRMYGHHHHIFHSKSDLIMLNGIYDTASGYPDVLTSGIELAKAESMPAHALISRDDDMLNIALPALKVTSAQTRKPMELVFYAYDQSISFMRPVTVNYLDPLAAQNETPAEQSFINTMIKAAPSTITNVITHGTMLGEWHGAAETISINIEGIKADHYAVIAQEENFGPVRVIATTESTAQ